MPSFDIVRTWEAPESFRVQSVIGGQATLYQLTTRAHVAILLNQINPDMLIKEADEDTLIAELAALTLFLEKTAPKDKT